MLTTILVIVGVGVVLYFGYQKFGSKKTTTTTTKKTTTSGGGSRTTANVGDKPRRAKAKK